jgi:putative SOS response-associated peptidase YedK
MMAEPHDGMPVVLELEDRSTWLEDVEGDPVALMRPAGEKVLKV